MTLRWWLLAVLSQGCFPIINIDADDQAATDTHTDAPANTDADIATNTDTSGNVDSIAPTEPTEDSGLECEILPFEQANCMPRGDYFPECPAGWQCSESPAFECYRGSCEAPADSGTAP